MRSLINHGRDTAYLSIDDDNKIGEQQLKTVVEKRFLFTNRGFSYCLSELEAAIAVSQLSVLKTTLRKRNRNVLWLNKALKPLCQYLILPNYQSSDNYSYMVYPLVLTTLALKNFDNCRSKLLFFLEKNGIETRPFLPILGQPAYKNLRLVPTDFPVGKYYSQNGFYIGCHQNLTLVHLRLFVKLLNQFFLTSTTIHKHKVKV